jgi:hypothetical protein
MEVRDSEAGWVVMPRFSARRQCSPGPGPNDLQRGRQCIGTA